LTINNINQANLPYTTYASTFAYTVETLTGLRPLAWTTGDFDDGFTNYFLFSGFPKD